MQRPLHRPGASALARHVLQDAMLRVSSLSIQTPHLPAAWGRLLSLKSQRPGMDPKAPEPISQGTEDSPQASWFPASVPQSSQEGSRGAADRSVLHLLTCPC